MSRLARKLIEQTQKAIGMPEQGEPDKVWVTHLPPTAGCKHGPGTICNECTEISWTVRK